MSKLDHEKRSGLDRMKKQGVDNIAEMGLLGGLNPPRQRPSKADLRAELGAAEAQITRLIHCQCGHKATVAIPSSWMQRRLRCTQCGASQ